MACPHQIHGDTQLHVLGPQDAGTKRSPSLKGDLQKSYECDNTAVALMEVQQFPTQAAEVKGEAAKLSQEDLEVPAKK